MKASLPKNRAKPRATSPTRDPERTRAAILRAATDEITAKGLTGARVDAIAKRAGVNKRMLYHYFGDKQGLYLAVLEHTYAAIRTAEIGLNLTELDPIAGMRKLVLFTWQYFIDHPEFLSLLATENMNRASYLKRSKNIRPLHGSLVDMISVLLKRGAEQGVFRTGVDPVELYISIAGLGFFYMSNPHTLSTIFRKNLGPPGRLAARFGRPFVEVDLRPAQRIDLARPRPDTQQGDEVGIRSRGGERVRADLGQLEVHRRVLVRRERSLGSRRAVGRRCVRVGRRAVLRQLCESRGVPREISTGDGPLEHLAQHLLVVPAFDPRAQPEDRALLLRALVLLRVRQPLVGEIGHRDRLLAHIDAGVLLTLELAQIVGHRLAGRTRDPLPAALAVRTDAEVDRGDPAFDRDAAPGPRESLR